MNQDTYHLSIRILYSGCVCADYLLVLIPETGIVVSGQLTRRDVLYLDVITNLLVPLLIDETKHDSERGNNADCSGLKPGSAVKSLFVRGCPFILEEL